MSIPKRIMVYIKKEGCSKNAYDFTPEDTIKEVKEAIIKKTSFTNVALKPQAYYKAERDKIDLTAADGTTLSEESIIKEVMKDDDTLSYSFNDDLKLPKYKDKEPK